MRALRGLCKRRFVCVCMCVGVVCVCMRCVCLCVRSLRECVCAHASCVCLSVVCACVLLCRVRVRRVFLRRVRALRVCVECV